ncbi:MAG: SDR family oxidoreductase [Dehalococcoidia bacterium]|nr:MAG: SDR family oxidoreductase [Dehalococcoidia bacterium]
MDLELAGRSVIVTGASRGIGRAIAAAFIGEGAHVTICARGRETLEATAGALRAAASGARVEAVIADLTTEAGAAAVLDRAVGTFGGVDVLVNNAGATVRGNSIVDEFERSFDLNVLAPLRMMELARPYLQASGQGAVVNISSIYGRESGGPPQYNASKSAQIAMTKSLALEWVRDGIRVNNVAPGSVAFEGGSWGRRLQEDPEGMAAFVRENIPGGRFGTVQEIARAVVFLASPAASWIVGATLNVDGGQSRSNI